MEGALEGGPEGVWDVESHTGTLVTVMVGYRGAMLACKSYQHRHLGTHAKPWSWGGEYTKFSSLTLISHFALTATFGRVRTDVTLQLLMIFIVDNP